MAKQEIELAREKSLYRYSSALERGDFDAVSQVLAEAEQDPEMERLVLEINEALQAEMASRQAAVAPIPDARWSLARLLLVLASGTAAAKHKIPGARWSLARLLRRPQEHRTGGRSVRAKAQPYAWRWLSIGGAVLGLVLVFAIGWIAYSRAGYSARASIPAFIPAGQRWFALEQPAAIPHPPAPTPAPVPTKAPYETYASDASPPTERLIIRSGNIEMVVKDTRAAQKTIETMVAGMAGEGAYIVSSEEQGGTDENLPYISMNIRIPVARFDETMDRLAEMAVQVLSRHEAGQDVTEEYVDLDARLESLEVARRRLLEIMQEARTTEALLQVERQLTEREAEIESLKGRMQYLERSAKLSSIRIGLQPYSLSQPVDVQWHPALTVRRAVESLVDGVQGLGDFFIFFAIAVLPWLVGLGLVLYGIVRLVRWRSRARGQKRAPLSRESGPQP